MGSNHEFIFLMNMKTKYGLDLFLKTNQPDHKQIDTVRLEPNLF